MMIRLNVGRVSSDLAAIFLDLFRRRRNINGDSGSFFSRKVTFVVAVDVLVSWILPFKAINELFLSYLLKAPERRLRSADVGSVLECLLFASAYGRLTTLLISYRLSFQFSSSHALSS